MKEKKQGGSGFVQRLITKMIINAQLTVRNFHLRIENASETKSPVSVGVFFPELSVISTNERWEPAYNTEPPMVYKV